MAKFDLLVNLVMLIIFAVFKIKVNRHQCKYYKNRNLRATTPVRTSVEFSHESFLGYHFFFTFLYIYLLYGFFRLKVKISKKNGKIRTLTPQKSFDSYNPKRKAQNFCIVIFFFFIFSEFKKFFKIVFYSYIILLAMLIGKWGHQAHYKHVDVPIIMWPIFIEFGIVVSE